MYILYYHIPCYATLIFLIELVFTQKCSLSKSHYMTIHDDFKQILHLTSSLPVFSHILERRETHPRDLLRN